jgi:predicted ATPase
LVQLAGAPDTNIAVLAGEPGIGKTRLVRELLNRLPPETTVLVGQAEPGSLGRPFELLLSAVDGRDGVDPEELDTLTDSSRTQVERLRTGLRMLLRLTADGPAVVVFEDLHWADSESIALFERIADLEGQRLLLGTYRPAEVIRRNPIAGLLDRLERRYEVYHVQLERGASAETSAFLTAAVGRPPPYRAAVSLHNRTGGNPFFLEELLRTCRTTTSKSSATVHFRGVLRRRCAARSNIWIRPTNGSLRRPRCSATGCRSTCSPRSRDGRG